MNRYVTALGVAAGIVVGYTAATYMSITRVDKLLVGLAGTDPPPVDPDTQARIVQAINGPRPVPNIIPIHGRRHPTYANRHRPTA